MGRIEKNARANFCELFVEWSALGACAAEIAKRRCAAAAAVQRRTDRVLVWRTARKSHTVRLSCAEGEQFLCAWFACDFRVREWVRKWQKSFAGLYTDADNRTVRSAHREGSKRNNKKIGRFDQRCICSSLMLFTVGLLAATGALARSLTQFTQEFSISFCSLQALCSQHRRTLKPISEPQQKDIFTSSHLPHKPISYSFIYTIIFASHYFRH